MGWLAGANFSNNSAAVALCKGAVDWLNAEEPISNKTSNDFI
jgi:hypothetical protein